MKIALCKTLGVAIRKGFSWVWNGIEIAIHPHGNLVSYLYTY